MIKSPKANGKKLLKAIIREEKKEVRCINVK